MGAMFLLQGYEKSKRISRRFFKPNCAARWRTLSGKVGARYRAGPSTCIGTYACTYHERRTENEISFPGVKLEEEGSGTELIGSAAGMLRSSYFIRIYAGASLSVLYFRKNYIYPAHHGCE